MSRAALAAAPATSPAAPKAAPVDPAAVQAKFAATRREMAAAIIEREEETDLVLTALVAGEHVLFVGPPGAAKSMLLDALVDWMDAPTFSVLLTKFTTPEEVVGPIALSALKQDRYVRVTTNRLPEAVLAHVDEVFKGSSAILNTLLRILNERVFENDGVWHTVPLQLCVAASNEWPSPEGGKELNALLDRFLFRKTVGYVKSAAGRDRLLFGADLTPRLSTRVTAEEVEAARAAAAALPWADAAKDALREILAKLADAGVVPGDRRKRKAVAAARAFAWLDGASEVEPGHLEVLAHVLWDDPETHPEKARAVVRGVANPTGEAVANLVLEAQEILDAVEPKNLGQMSVAASKLREVAQRLGKLKDARAARAADAVKDDILRLTRAAMDLGI